tara:strand:+ start:214 stop:909 length:696 start_codon:yes stop_codon:yes gene_type:complete
LNKEKNIFITGGNRGIGRGLVKSLSNDHNVFFSVRDREKGETVLTDLTNSSAKYIIMDVSSNDSVNQGMEKLKKIASSIDILINNAGILIPGLGNSIPAIETDENSILKTFNVNTLGVLRVCREVVPLMPFRSRIINISSGMGQLQDMDGGNISYRLSKVALNGLTKVLSNELLDKKININAICPGWVQTDMGGSNATLTVEESATMIIDFVLSDNFPNGKFLRHGEIIPW